MHRCLLARVVVELATDLNMRRAPAEDGNHFILVEINRFARGQLSSEDFSETSFHYQHLDVVPYVCDSQFVARFECLVEEGLRHGYVRRQDLLVGVHFL